MYIAFKWLLALTFLLWLCLCITKIFQVDEEHTIAIDFYCDTNSIKKDLSYLWLIEEINVFSITTYKYNMLFGVMVLCALCKNQNLIFCRCKLKLDHVCEHIVSILKNIYLISNFFVYYLKRSYPFKPLWQNSRVSLVNNDCKVINLTIFFLIIQYLIKERQRLAKKFTLSHEVEKVDNHKLQRFENIKLPNEIIHKPAAMIYSSAAKYNQSYIQLHYENWFLRSSLDKLAKEKKTIERNLLNVVLQVFLTDNNFLKAYCSKFVVQNKDDLFKADMELEVQKFLTRPKLCKDNSNKNMPRNINRIIDGLYSSCKKVCILPVKARNNQMVNDCELYSESKGKNDYTARRIRDSYFSYKAGNPSYR